MSVTIFKNNHLLGVVVTGILLSLPMSASAKCGGVDYSWGADALSNAHDYTVTMMLYVVYLSYAVAGLVAVIGASCKSTSRCRLVKVTSQSQS